VNQHERGCFRITRFLIMNSNAIQLDEARVLGMENDFAVLAPVSIAWARQKLSGDGNRCGCRG